MTQSSPSSPPMLAGTDPMLEAPHAPYEGARSTTLPTLRAEASSSAPVQSPHNHIQHSSRAISSISSPTGQEGIGMLNVLNNPPAPPSQLVAHPSLPELSKAQSPTHPYWISLMNRTLAEEKAQCNAIPPSARSQYMQMLLALDDIPLIYDICASGFIWILLAGFILFPGTFTSTLRELDLGDGAAARVVDRIVNLPLFVVAFTCTGIGYIGMIFLWWRWMNNYIWLTSKVFMPGLMNALTGVLSTLTNVYGAQQGEFTTTSIITISVTSGVLIVCVGQVVLYQFILLRWAKNRHVQEIGVEKAGKYGEGMWTGPKSKSVS